jgi:D-alanyl-D-alanine carboxypeptidase/D-alanyl-D-alanine-endopeptidase (penicillin-binding protein 4)
VLASVSADTALNPASNAKLFTAAAALAKLGPDYRWTTSIHGRVENGVAQRLVLRGHGDPSLQSRDLAALARELVALGLKRVTGEILVDQSRFDARFVPPGFEQQPNEWAAFRAPVSAVAVDRNSIALHVAPGRAGAPARTWADPPGFVELVGNVTTAAKGRGDRVRIALRPERGRLRVELGGEIAEGAPRAEHRRRVDDPRRFAGYVLAYYLGREGVELQGAVGEGGADERALLVSHVSAPLSSMLQELGKRSDNFYAEMIMKTLGAEAGGGPGTSARGASAVSDWLRVAGALDAGTRVVNGSGLFDANRASATSFVRALSAAYRDPAISSEFVAQLAIGGVDGTLRSRFRSERQTRAIRAKTGTLARNVALSGYVLARARSPVAFSILVSELGAKQTELRERMDRVVLSAAR